jgi:hypothetical protein
MDVLDGRDILLEGKYGGRYVTSCVAWVTCFLTRTYENRFKVFFAKIYESAVVVSLLVPVGYTKSLENVNGYESCNPRGITGLSVAFFRVE